MRLRLPNQHASEAGSAEAPAGYWLTRFVILRLLGAVYAAAFLALAVQVLPLIGSQGLLPAGAYLERLVDHFGSPVAAYRAVPTLFWIDRSDAALLAGAWTGLALALAVAAGYANALVLFLLWLLYGSYVRVGQTWLGYGWEIQLLETGFLAIFLCPLLDGRPFPKRPPPLPVIWLMRWLIVRVMLGAGLIKLRGDPCWRDFSCLDFHFETQPIPNPLSPWLHFLPAPLHRVGVAFTWVTELLAPLFALGPRRARLVAGAVMGLFQVVLIASGNLSFLNYLTIVPILACFDDRVLRRALPARLVARAERASREAEPSRAQGVAALLLLVGVGVLSVNPVANLLSPRQVMNTSFDAFDLVNTYGHFGSVGRDRLELVIEGTRDAVVGPDTRWSPYEFPCKPGDPGRRPCVVSPYQPRLAWQLWFAAMSTADRTPWTLHLVWKLLRGDPALLALLETNPFPDEPPAWIRADLYRYRFAPLGGDGWWRREKVGSWLPPLGASDPRLRAFLRAYGWGDPADETGRPGP